MHSNVDTLIHCESSYLSVVQSESDNKSYQPLDFEIIMSDWYLHTDA